jgi:hypothetical protein
MSNSMKKGYKINFVSNTITLSKAFEANAMNPSSAEFKTLSELMKAFPRMKIVQRIITRKSNKSKLTYSDMRKYIEALPNNATHLVKFEKVKELGKAQKNPYLFVKTWFIAMFPRYNQTPVFDERGNLSLYTNPAAAEEAIAKTEMPSTPALKEVS